jgi:hypothetical protein
MWVTLRRVYSRRKRTTVADHQHTTAPIIIRYPIDSGCSKFGLTPDGGGTAPEISKTSVKNVGRYRQEVQGIHKRRTHSLTSGAQRGTLRSLDRPGLAFPRENRRLNGGYGMASMCQVRAARRFLAFPEVVMHYDRPILKVVAFLDQSHHLCLLQ